LCLGEGKDFVVAKFTVWLSILAVLVMQRKVDCIYLGCQDGEELNPHGNECAIKDPLPPKGQMASHNMQSLSLVTMCGGHGWQDHCPLVSCCNEIL